MDEETDFYEMSLGQIRELRGLTKRELSRITGISENSLYLIEEKGQIPRADTLAKLCRALGISAKQGLHSLGIDVSQIPNE